MEINDVILKDFKALHVKSDYQDVAVIFIVVLPETAQRFGLFLAWGGELDSG